MGLSKSHGQNAKVSYLHRALQFDPAECVCSVYVLVVISWGLFQLSHLPHQGV
jgi:hypothetical protein